jgi:hypothetical protein
MKVTLKNSKKLYVIIDTKPDFYCKNSFFSPGFSFYFWDLNFFFRALICLNFILEYQFLYFKSKNSRIWAELLFKNVESFGILWNQANEK